MVLAGKVRDRLDGVAGLQNVQHAHGVERGDLHLALGLVVEGGCHVGRHCGDVQSPEMILPVTSSGAVAMVTL